MKKSEKKGYTLIELMIVIVIIGVLTSIILPHMVKGRYNAQFTSCQFNVRALASALESYKVDKGTYPKTDSEYKNLFTGAPPYLQPEPVCPSNNKSYGYKPLDENDGNYADTNLAANNYVVYCNGIHHLIIKSVSNGFPQYKPATGLMPTQNIEN